MSSVLDANGPAAPPRRNGELAFEAPWESRLFGLTMSLHRAGVFAWEEFRTLLIEEIGRWQARAGTGEPGSEPWSYWERWGTALETLLARRRVCTREELATRVEVLLTRPTGHDH